MAKVLPSQALHRLESTIGGWNIERLATFKRGRRSIVYALEYLAAHDEFFERAATLLLALAEAENEHWSNNATGVFAELFSLGPGRVSSTSAPPATRLPVLVSAFRSDSPARRAAAFKALDESLKIRAITRMVRDYTVGLSQQTLQWNPETYGELYDAFRLYWQTARSIANELPTAADVALVHHTLLSHSRELIGVANLSDMVLDYFNQPALLSDETTARKLVATLEEILHYDRDKLSTDLTEKLDNLLAGLINKDFRSRLRRYVGLQLVQDHFDGEGRVRTEPRSELEELAKESVQNPEVLIAELDWLVSTDAKNAYRFGLALARADTSSVFWPSLFGRWVERFRVAEPTSSYALVSGYLMGVAERSRDEWDKLLEIVSNTSGANTMLLELTWRSGYSDRAVRRVLGLVSQGTIRPEKLRLLGLGGYVDSLEPGHIEAIVKFLLDEGRYACTSAALDVVSMRVYALKGKIDISESLCWELLSHESLFDLKDDDRIDQMDDHHWTMIAKPYIRESSIRMGEVFGIGIRNVNRSRTIFRNSSTSIEKFLATLLREHFAAVWPTLTKELETDDGHRHWILDWLGGPFNDEKNIAPMSYVPLDELFAWIDEDVPQRAQLIARSFPVDLSEDSPTIDRFVAFVGRYGNRVEVRRALEASWYTGLWSGQESARYNVRLIQLETLGKRSLPRYALRWANETKESLREDLERAIYREERDDF